MSYYGRSNLGRSLRRSLYGTLLLSLTSLPLCARVKQERLLFNNKSLSSHSRLAELSHPSLPLSLATHFINRKHRQHDTGDVRCHPSFLLFPVNHNARSTDSSEAPLCVERCAALRVAVEVRHTAPPVVLVTVPVRAQI